MMPITIFVGETLMMIIRTLEKTLHWLHTMLKFGVRYQPKIIISMMKYGRVINYAYYISKYSLPITFNYNMGRYVQSQWHYVSYFPKTKNYVHNIVQ